MWSFILHCLYQKKIKLGKFQLCQNPLKLLPSSAQAQAPAGLSSIIITVGHLAFGHPEKYDFQARAMLGSSLAKW